MEHDFERNDELSSIQSETKELWLRKIETDTTYRTFHYNSGKLMKRRSRPSSPTRRNNPQPSMAFLTYKLKDTPQERQEAVTRPFTVAGIKHEDSLKNKCRCKLAEQFRKVHAVDAQAIKAWQKLAPSNDAMLADELDMTDLMNVRSGGSCTADDQGTVSLRLSEALNSKKYSQEMRKNVARRHPYNPKSFYPQMKLDEFQPRYPKRGDFLLHPDWPPYLDHHKLSCMH